MSDPVPPPRGFRFAGVPAGIKRQAGALDLGLVVADAPAVVAGAFTRNLVRAAPVTVAERRVARGRARAILVNSGNANACTGEPGLAAALETTAAVASALGVEAEEVLPASTGVIGAPLPTAKIVGAVPALVAALGASVEPFSRAIMTTDRWPKVAAARAGSAAVLGVAKGAGMIHPDVGPPQATMLVFLLTDAVVERAPLADALLAACDVTFNAATVDGDTSTNDTVLALASGASGDAPPAAALEAALTEVCAVLARSMVRDGEGAGHVAELTVRGLRTDAEARVVARTVATSLLVKTALFGQDSNWGRILAAAGRAGVRFDPGRAALAIGGVTILERGLPLGPEPEARASAAMRAETYAIELVLGDGPGQARYLTSDLGHGYVDVNAGYRS
ncbi:MAG TPA: bifunctional glutamate N-acetyltransferase/amino-acid acetyltransferase ArgJ [Polyangiaceae bacterium]|nr:bifunctional glutamate N-acetyltransferase/amino-acid acetyltransferase ArgJ [Polyangiaceae bacterium]